MEASIADYLRRYRTGKVAKPRQCQVCGLACSLRWHGKYHRSLMTLSRTYGLDIKRLYCGLCRHTFALLPSFVVKFHRYARHTIDVAMRRLRSHTYEAVADWLMERGGLYVAPLTLYFWRRKFA